MNLYLYIETPTWGLDSCSCRGPDPLGDKSGRGTKVPVEGPFRRWFGEPSEASKKLAGKLQLSALGRVPPSPGEGRRQRRRPILGTRTRFFSRSKTIPKFIVFFSRFGGLLGGVLGSIFMLFFIFERSLNFNAFLELNDSI